MNKLIVNEWIKLFTRKRIIVLIVLTLLSGLIAVAAVKLDDHNNRTSWQETYQNQIDMYNRQLTRYPQFDETEWENDCPIKRSDAMEQCDPEISVLSG